MSLLLAPRWGSAARTPRVPAMIGSTSSSANGLTELQHLIASSTHECQESGSTDCVVRGMVWMVPVTAS